MHFKVEFTTREKNRQRDWGVEEEQFAVSGIFFLFSRKRCEADIGKYSRQLNTCY